MQLIDYYWFITAALMIITYKIGIVVGEANITQAVLDIIEKKTKK